jgi:hypothetical protein
MSTSPAEHGTLETCIFQRCDSQLHTLRPEQMLMSGHELYLYSTGFPAAVVVNKSSGKETLTSSPFEKILSNKFGRRETAKPQGGSHARCTRGALCLKVDCCGQ